MTGQYDVIIVGTGAGGATLAHHLAPSGKRILLLERGGHLPREKENWDSREVFVKGRYKAEETWLDKEGRTFHPGIHYYVGGNTTVYGAALLRFRKQDFGEIRHHGGVSPAWPITYDELAPYYLKAEQLHDVHGLRGSDPTEPLFPNPTLRACCSRTTHPGVARRPEAARTSSFPPASGRTARRGEPPPGALH